MADIISIAIGTYRPGINKIGDIVDVLEDGKFKDNSFTIQRVQGMSVEEVKAELNKRVPEKNTCFRLDASQNTWTFDRPEEKQVWQDPIDSKWKDLKVDPKYSVSMAGIVKKDLTILEDKAAKKDDKIIILGKTVDRVSDEPTNKETTISITDLHG